MKKRFLILCLALSLLLLAFPFSMNAYASNTDNTWNGKFEPINNTKGASLTVSGPSSVHIGDTFDVTFAWNNIDFSEYRAGSIDVYFYFDARFIEIPENTVRISEIDTDTWESYGNASVSASKSTTADMQLMKIAITIDEDYKDTINSLTVTVGFKAVALGTSEFDWYYAALAAYGDPTGDHYAEVANTLSDTTVDLAYNVTVIASSADEDETSSPSEDTTAPSEDTTAPSEDTTAPSEDTTAPSEDTTAPSEDTTAPSEDTTAPSEDTTAPSEDTTAPPEDTTAPSEDKVYLYTNKDKYEANDKIIITTKGDIAGEYVGIADAKGNMMGYAPADADGITLDDPSWTWLNNNGPDSIANGKFIIGWVDATGKWLDDEKDSRITITVNPPAQTADNADTMLLVCVAISAITVLAVTAVDSKRRYTK